MSILDVTNRTIKCDAPECPNEVTFNPAVQEEIVALPDWLRTTRTITLGNNTRFTYCCDTCEVKGVTTGNHNVPEPKQVQEATPAQAKQVVEQAKIVEKLKVSKNQNKKLVTEK
jgi:hypothetical protein